MIGQTAAPAKSPEHTAPVRPENRLTKSAWQKLFTSPVPMLLWKRCHTASTRYLAKRGRGFPKDKCSDLPAPVPCIPVHPFYCLTSAPQPLTPPRSEKCSTVCEPSVAPSSSSPIAQQHWTYATERSSSKDNRSIRPQWARGCGRVAETHSSGRPALRSYLRQSSIGLILSSYECI